MKRLIYIIGIVTIFVISGCKKILEPQITSQINADDFPKSESDVRSALIPLYAQFNTSYGNTNSSNGNLFEFSFNASYLGYNWATTTQTDEAKDLSNSPYSNFILAPATYLTSNGRSIYNRIRYVAKATDIIDKIDKSDLANKALLAAEAKGLRAWFMFILFDLYGPVNVKLDPNTLNSTVIEPRPSNEAYVAAMEKDLTEAIAVLPDKYNNSNNWGRISKGVARMVLLKVYMHQKNWIEAEKVGKALMTMGYSLNNSYKNVFTTSQNNEVIYAVPGNDAVNNIWFKTIIPSDAAKVLGTTVQVNNYKLIEMPWAYYDKYPANDTRLLTIANSYTKANGTEVTRTTGLSGAIPVKYTNYRPDEKGYDFVLLRYSDVLLSMAEIVNELRGPTAEAQGYLKQVTDRAGITASIPATTFDSPGQMRDYLLDERGRELYWEFGIRRQDLIRHGKLITSAKARGFANAADHQVLWPIPSDVIIESNGIIKQNPGYN
ncbi:MAG TPA: RagB/SusD family nutrient uptake outer membrane protein [Pedobacter sp.]|jgi:hypothetical protein